MPNHALCGTSAAREWDARGALTPVASAVKKPGQGSGGSGGSYDAYITDVLSQVIGGPVRTYGLRNPTGGTAQTPSPTSDVWTLLDTHIHDGNPWTVDGQTISVATHTGRLRTATTATLNSVLLDIQPGDTIQLRAGTYTGEYGPYAGYNSSQINVRNTESGTATQPIHFTAYPGETVNLSKADGGNFFCGQRTQATRCDYWNVSAINFSGLVDNIYGGGETGNTSAPESGGRFWRLVGCTFYRQWNDEAHLANVGQVEWEGDGWKVLACTFLNNLSGGTWNQAHAIYVDCGSDDFEIGYCKFPQRIEGFIFMTHQDGTPMLYSNGRLHHCYAQPNSPNGARGFATSNVDDASDLTIEDNWFDGCGDSVNEFGPVTVNRGHCYLRRNLFTNSTFPLYLSNNYGGTCTLHMGTGANRNVWDGTPFDRNTAPTSTYFSFDTAHSIANVVNEA